MDNKGKVFGRRYRTRVLLLGLSLLTLGLYSWGWYVEPSEIRAAPVSISNGSEAGAWESRGSGFAHLEGAESRVLIESAPRSGARRGSYRVRIVVRGVDGSVTDPSGIEWRLQQLSGMESRAAEQTWTIEGDETVIEALPGDRLVLLEAHLGDREVTSGNRTLRVGEDSPLTFVCSLIDSGLVRVIDARTAEDLPHVQIVSGRCSDRLSAHPALAGLRDGCLEWAASPIALPVSTENTPYWIGAPGFAWRRIEFGEGSGSPVFALEPGGGLKVDAHSPRDRSVEFVLELERVVPGSSRVEQLAVETLAPDAQLEFSGLPVGTIVARFRAHVEDRWDEVVAEQRVEVKAGEVAELALDITELWKGSTFGTAQVWLALEDRTDARALKLRLEPLDTGLANMRSFEVSQLEVGRGGQFVGDVGGLPVGRYRVSVVPGTAQIELTVESGSTTIANLDVPALPKLRLWVLDAKTSSELRPDRILWRSMTEANRADWVVAQAWTVDGAAEFPVKTGRIEVGVQAQGYVTGKIEFEIQAGRNEESIDLEPLDPREIVVHLTAGGLDVPASEETWIATTATDAWGQAALLSVRPLAALGELGGSSGSARSVLVVNGPGTYRIALGPVPGFRVPPEQQVVIAEGRSSASLTIALGLNPAAGR